MHLRKFNLLEAAGLPQTKKRKRENQIKESYKKVAEKLDFDFYDSDRECGFGGYYYDGRWRNVAKAAKERYNLNPNSKVLIDRCHKGFLVYDLKKLIPGIEVYGAHPSEYPINHAMEGYGRWVLINKKEKGDSKIIEEKARQEIMPYLLKVDNLNLPFKDKYFDSVISIHNICNYKEPECRKALKEIIRISKNNGRNCYIQNDSWTNKNEKEKLMEWVLICKTFLDTSGWKNLFEEEGYKGDYGFVMFE